MLPMFVFIFQFVVMITVQTRPTVQDSTVHTILKVMYSFAIKIQAHTLTHMRHMWESVIANMTLATTTIKRKC